MAKFKLVEAPLNLVSMQQGWLICFAVSADMDCSVGLPKLMNTIYDITSRYDEEGETGKSAIIGNVGMLFVKDDSYSSVEISDIQDALQDLREKCEENNITKIAMPKICTGRNGLKWREVRSSIKAIFTGSDIFVLICDM